VGFHHQFLAPAFDEQWPRVFSWWRRSPPTVQESVNRLYGKGLSGVLSDIAGPALWLCKISLARHRGFSVASNQLQAFEAVVVLPALLPSRVTGYPSDFASRRVGPDC
jgi:hypothetical protein